MSADVSQLMGTLTSLPQQLTAAMAPLLDGRNERLQAAVRAEIGTGLVRMAPCHSPRTSALVIPPPAGLVSVFASDN